MKKYYEVSKRNKKNTKWMIVKTDINNIEEAENFAKYILSENQLYSMVQEVNKEIVNGYFFENTETKQKDITE